MNYRITIRSDKPQALSFDGEYINKSFCVQADDMTKVMELLMKEVNEDNVPSRYLPLSIIVDEAK
jgi:hypothetical protein